MKACWNELFALGLAQCSSVMNVGTILAAIINHLQTSLQEGKWATLVNKKSNSLWFYVGNLQTLSLQQCLSQRKMFFSVQCSFVLRGKTTQPSRLHIGSVFCLYVLFSPFICFLWENWSWVYWKLLCSLAPATLVSSKLVLILVPCREAVPRASEGGNGAHLEDAGVL